MRLVHNLQYININIDIPWREAEAFVVLCFVFTSTLFGLSLAGWWWVLCVCLKGFLDDQFNQLQQLQDESNPDFVVEVVTLFFEDSERLLDELAKALWES